MSVTLKEVAELAGVSIGTASQALNQRGNVAHATRSRVVDAARNLGYPLKLNRIDAEDARLSMIGMLIKHDLNYPVDVNPFYSHVQAGVERECRTHGINLMYAAVEVDESNHPVIWPSLINEKQLDGLLLIGTFIDPLVGFVHGRTNIPMVLIDSYATESAFDTVLTDNAQGTRLIVEHLIAQGHRHIGLVGYNPKSPPSFQERHRAYLETLRCHAIERSYVASSFHSTRSAYEATQELLRTSPEVTAVFGCMDLAAIGALNAVRDMHLNVPTDISIAGFDNIDLANEVRPSLTTVHVHKNWMGMIGVRRLIERIQYPEQPPTTTLLSTRLIVRDSVAAPRVLSA
ncbi:MAG: LacI family DNA-binding transcriptional regulator [Caldilineaceae bacterium]|nr:LacI family DNA-binding transcriptional regulator [Caldilineaceae bacterium]